MGSEWTNEFSKNEVDFLEFRVLEHAAYRDTRNPTILQKVKESIIRCTLRAHPIVNALLSLETDASSSALSAVFQQLVNKEWQHLAFFSKKLNKAQHLYSAYDWELPAIYESVKHFTYMVEGRHFVIYKDHTYAFRKNNQKCSPRQFNHLDFISQFTTDI